MRFAILFSVGLAWGTAPALCEDAPPVELVLSPQAVEGSLLKHRLLPAESELKPGDAATILLKLPWDQMPYMTRVYPTLPIWATRPLDAPEWKDFEKEFVLPENFYQVMKRAAYRRDANWAYPIGEAPLSLILLPDVQGIRNFLGHGLAARARYHLTRGELERAQEVISVGLANARHVAQGPFVVSQAVAASIHNSMLDQTALLMAQPGSPNLYWALSMLPDSLLSVERAADLEADMLTSTLPAIRELDRPREKAEWTRMADQLIDYLRFSDFLAPQNDPGKQRTDLGTQAREELSKTVAKERVAKMSDDEALIRWLVRVVTDLEDRRSIAFRLPPGEAAAHLRELDAETKRLAGTGIQFPVARVRSQYVALRGVSRKIHALRTIEAVRHYLATHEVSFPERLDAITELVIPLDPLSNRPFEWTVDRETNTAVLKTPPIGLEFGDPAAGVLIYQLRVR